MPDRFTRLIFFLKIFPISINTFFPHHPGKNFYPDCVASLGHLIWEHNQFEISVLLGAPSLVKTNENHWRLSKGSDSGS
jgi:hypothetical protein